MQIGQELTKLRPWLGWHTFLTHGVENVRGHAVLCADGYEEADVQMRCGRVTGARGRLHLVLCSQLASFGRISASSSSFQLLVTAVRVCRATTSVDCVSVRSPSASSVSSVIDLVAERISAIFWL